MKKEEYIVPENVIPIIRNEQVLEILPDNISYVSKEDLVVLFFIEVPPSVAEQINLISLPVTEEIVKSWEMDIQEVYEVALKNMHERNYIKIYTMDGIMTEQFFELKNQEFSKETMEEMEEPFLVVTTEYYAEGAVGILDTNKLQEISEIAGEDLYVIPSSIHECLLLPKSKMKLQEIREKLMYANINVIKPEDWLSDNVYEYSAVTKEIAITGDNLRERDSVEHIR